MFKKVGAVGADRAGADAVPKKFYTKH